MLAVLGRGPASVDAIVAEIYAAYPKGLHAAAAHQIAHHLKKLENEGRAVGDALKSLWSLP